MSVANATRNAEPSRNYLMAKNAKVVEKFEERNLENSVAYIIPVLDSLPANFTMLDVGSGPGTITMSIAKRYPSASFIGVDGGSDSVARAREIAAREGVKNVQFLFGDALDLGSVPELRGKLGTFDLVHTHMVLVHLTDAKRGMRELYKAARPNGGYVCCCEADFGNRIFYPEPENWDYVWGITTPELMRARGADPHVGRKLVSLALAAGFKRPDITAGITANVRSTPEERKWMSELLTANLRDEQGLRLAKEHGIEVDKIFAFWKEWEEREDGWACVAMPWVICRKQ